MKRKAFLIFALLVFFSAFSFVCYGEENLDEWIEFYEKHNPMLIEYLKSLDSNWIGKKVPGVELSRNIELKDYTYLGKTEKFGKGANIYLFSTQDTEVAYIFVEKDGDPFLLDLNDYGIIPPGQRVITGDIYTWKHVKPGGVVVIVLCPKMEWINSIKNEVND